MRAVDDAAKHDRRKAHRRGGVGIAERRRGVVYIDTGDAEDAGGIEVPAGVIQRGPAAPGERRVTRTIRAAFPDLMIVSGSSERVVTRG